MPANQQQLSKAPPVSAHQIHLPPPQRPTEILVEDEHLARVSRIIERDFFPDLQTLRNQTAFLGAVEDGALGRAKMLGEALRGESKEAKDDQGLDHYLFKHTSEDNDSFARLLDEENEARKRKYVWHFSQEKKAICLDDNKATAALIEDSPTPTASTGNPHLIEPKKHEVAKVGTWGYKTINSLMYFPDAAPLTLHDAISKPHAKLPPKSITHSATRLPTSLPTTSLLRAASDAAADRLATQEVWRNMAAETPALFPHGIDAISNSHDKFVPSTPSLEPNVDVDPEDLMTWGMIDGTPILVDSGVNHAKGFRIPDTPRREIVADRLAEKARRDIKMRVDGKSSASAGSLSSSSGVFRKPVDPKLSRLASPYTGRMLSPAAQRILGGSKAGGLFGDKKGGSVDAQLRASYSPSSRGGVSRSATQTPSSFVKPSPVVVQTPGKTPGASVVRRQAVGTPGASSAESRKKPAATAVMPAKGASLTDNLLDF
ncbi:DiGeorge syndrome critical region protein 14 [Podochytrium sp. JEL0797]|nr:DiGeorge syndrome critical region protein 14 [Podochytrium sp. JEL0797]